MLPTPYYQDAHITLYHADCGYLIGELSGDLVLTDPPYGLSHWGGIHTQLSRARSAPANIWDVQPPDDLLRAVVSAAPLAIVWGGNYLCGALGPWRRALVWDKQQPDTMTLAGAEIAWTNLPGSTSVYHLRASGAAQARTRGRQKIHPTEKPVSLISWCLRLSDLAPDSLILDPFAGSGTTGEAARLLGHRAILVEQYEPYCELMSVRFSQALLADALEVVNASLF